MSDSPNAVSDVIPRTYWNTTPIARLAGSVLFVAVCLYIGSALFQAVAPEIGGVLGWMSNFLLIIGGGLACHVPWPQSGDSSARERSAFPLPSVFRDRDWRSLFRGDIQIYQGNRDQNNVMATPRFPDHRQLPSHERPSGDLLAPAFWWGTLLLMLIGGGLVGLWGVDLSPPLPPASLSLWAVGVITVAIVLVHELIHAVVAAWYGSTVAIGISLPVKAYMRPSNVVLTRRQRLLIGLAPGVSLTLFGAICVLLGSGWLLTIGGMLLLVNTGSSGDAIRAWRVLTAPPGSLWYNSPEGTRSDRYDPVSPSSPSLAGRLQQRVFQMTEWLKLPTDRDGDIE
jgi:hypothetical protein